MDLDVFHFRSILFSFFSDDLVRIGGYSCSGKEGGRLSSWSSCQKACESSQCVAFVFSQWDCMMYESCIPQKSDASHTLYLRFYPWLVLHVLDTTTPLQNAWYISDCLEKWINKIKSMICKCCILFLFLVTCFLFTAMEWSYDFEMSRNQYIINPSHCIFDCQTEAYGFSSICISFSFLLVFIRKITCSSERTQILFMEMFL